MRTETKIEEGKSSPFPGMNRKKAERRSAELWLDLVSRHNQIGINMTSSNSRSYLRRYS